MKILVTGGAGCVGSVLVPMLLQHGYQVRVLDNLMYTGHSLLPWFLDPHFEFVRGDVRDCDTVRMALGDCDVIVHLAAIVGYPACQKDEDLALKVNYEASKTISDIRSKDQLLIYASTGSNYGELTDGICTEETPLNPLTVYGLTKSRAEHYIMCSGNAIALRFATAFGVSPRLRLDLLINDFTYRALKEHYLIVYERHFRRTFIHVRDMAQSILLCIENAQRMRNNVYNVGDASLNLTKEEIALKLKERLNFYLYFAEVGEDEDKRNYVVSYEKIAASGFRASVNLDIGIDELIRAFQVIDIRNPYSNV